MIKNMFTLLFAFTVAACDNANDTPTPQIPPTETVEAVYCDGITRISDDSLAFVLLAPGKQSVYLIGDFNNWKVSESYKMKKDGDRFRLKIGNLNPNSEYVCQYLIDSQLRIADPYANKISDPWNDKDIPATVYPDLIAYPTGKTSEIAMVVSTRKNDYNWKVNSFATPSPEKLVIYELLIRDFTEKGSINGVKEKIPYLKDLGVNAVELMPFNEFEANDSWGYNPSFYFATDKAYGTADDYRAFIDACHENGIAVIMDLVLNHSYGQSPLVRLYQNSDGSVADNNPWYNAKSNFALPDAQWGYDFNHESAYTQTFVDSVCAYWLTEYKIDGYRLDFTKGFSNTPHPATGDDNWGSLYDAARVKILKRIYNGIKRRKTDAVVICEHLAENREEKELADYGFLLWGNLNYNMNEATMGWGAYSNGGALNGDLSWASYLQRGWAQPHLVSYMESHDEERIMYKNLQYGNEFGEYRVKGDLATGLKRTEAAAVILLSIPGPKMLWQFGELGYDISIDYNGRLGKKTVRWDYYDAPARRSLHDVYSAMTKLHKTEPVFSTDDFSIDLTNNFKSTVLRTTNRTVVAMANFDVVQQTKTVNFGKTGTWNEYFSEQTLTTTANVENITLQAGEYRLYFND
jgi:1,4-alpha-glucan branching enzyme